MRSVYIHIPFCKSICSYCDFCKMYYNESWANKYLDALKEEINTYYLKDKINTIYIGGGTPSSLSEDNLKKLFDIIKVFDLDSNYEFTFECNINDINSKLLNILKANKVNRLSIGVESFNKKKLLYMNRNHTKKDIKKNIKLCRTFGFNNINVDFIYALPSETFRMMKRDFKKILSLKTEHISTYSLIIEENTTLYNMKAKNIDEDLDYKMYNYICKMSKRKKYNHYEVSNFAKKGFESVHNLTYWNNDEYYGFGLSASGFVDDVRYENTRNLNKYISKEYRLNELMVSTLEDMENEFILGLRLLQGVNLKKFSNKYNRDALKVFNTKTLIKKGYLKVNGDYISIPECKIYIMNEIINKMI